VELFPFGTEAGDSLAFTPMGIGLSSPLYFAGSSFYSVNINRGGLLSLGDYFYDPPRDFPFDSFPLIAPFWTDLSLNFSGPIYYRVLTNQTVIDRVNTGVDLTNNAPTSTYRSTSALLVTWLDEPLESGQDTGVIQAVLTSNGSQSYLFLVYSDYDFPRGAVVGINGGNGSNFISLATISEGNSNRIAFGSNSPVFQTRGIYTFRLDNLAIGSTTAPPCMNGDLRLSILSQASSNLMVGQALVCINGRFGGICSTGFDDSDALVFCRTYFMPLGHIATGMRKQPSLW